MEALKHYVLVGPRGKLAGFKNQARLALQMVAMCLSAAKLGGGIVDILLPKTNQELERIQDLLDRGYTFKETGIKKGQREEVRNAVMSDELMAKLAVRFAKEKKQSPRAEQAPVREFSKWICEKLQDLKQNDIKIIIEEAHPELPNMTREDWWKKQISQRVKKLKT